MRALLLLGMLWLGACTNVPSTIPHATESEITALSNALSALSPHVDPAEAQRAARIAFDYPIELRAAYGVTDPPLIHNAKVNRGSRPRGLCWHWADDLEARLAQEDFQTLTLHRAIANSNNPILIEHSTVIVSARGAQMDHGIVTDPWRYGGQLFWAPTLEDSRYTWLPRQQVWDTKAKKLKRRQSVQP